MLGRRDLRQHPRAPVAVEGVDPVAIRAGADDRQRPVATRPPPRTGSPSRTTPGPDESTPDRAPVAGGCRGTGRARPVDPPHHGCGPPSSAARRRSSLGRHRLRAGDAPGAAPGAPPGSARPRRRAGAAAAAAGARSPRAGRRTRRRRSQASPSRTVVAPGSAAVSASPRARARRAEDQQPAQRPGAALASRTSGAGIGVRERLLDARQRRADHLRVPVRGEDRGGPPPARLRSRRHRR